MDVSVAICTWNRAKLLDQTLEGMQKLHIPVGVEWDLLVVDNNCTDDTADVIARHAAHLPLTRLFEPKQGQSHARNAAIHAAESDWLIFTDDDVLVDEQWLVAYWDCMRVADQSIAVLGGEIVPWFEVEPDEDLSAAMPMVRRGFCGVSIPAKLDFDATADHTPLGANFGIRRSALGEIRFDINLGVVQEQRVAGEEVLFIQRLLRSGTKGRWVQGAKVAHFVGKERFSTRHLRRHLIGMGRSRVRTKWISGKAYVLWKNGSTGIVVRHSYFCQLSAC